MKTNDTIDAASERAVALALAEIPDRPDPAPRHPVRLSVVDQLMGEADKERALDEMMADVVEVVRRQRARLGRKVCSPHDGKTIRQITALLRAMSADISADNDPSFGEQP